MKDRTWLRRLGEEFPGWIAWTTEGWKPTDAKGNWMAAPAPPGTPDTDVYLLADRVSAATPAELRTLMRERYGWDDHCQSCGVLSRECGHRQPERDPRGE